jgi:hypothetical protein
MAVYTNENVPLGFAKNQANAKRIREAMNDLTPQELGNAVILVLTEEALRVVRQKLGDKLYRSFPGFTLAGTAQESLYASNLIRDCAATILLTEGRVITTGSDVPEIDPNVIEVAAEGGAS